jgi:hypothetical protein
LNGFVHDRNKPKLFVLDGKERRTFCPSPAKVAAERDFHRIEVEGYAPDVLENSFSTFETELSPALIRIIAARSINDENDRSYLLNLMALLAVKNPATRENTRQVQERICKIVLELATSSSEMWDSQVRRAKAEGDIPADADTDYVRMRSFVEADQYKIEVPTWRHLEEEIQHFETVLPYFFHRRWMLFKVPPQQTGFVTTDHPVCLLWSARHARFHGPDHGLRGTQILFSISNDLAVIGEFEGREGEMDVDQSFVAKFNGILMLSRGRAPP